MMEKQYEILTGKIIVCVGGQSIDVNSSKDAYTKSRVF